MQRPLHWLAAARSALCGSALALTALFGSTGAHAQVTLNFWDMIWGPPEYIDTAKALVAKFNKENPGIQVQYRSVPWANWYQTYVTAIGAGTAFAGARPGSSSSPRFMSRSSLI